MGRLRSGAVAAIKEEVADAIGCEAVARETLLLLLATLREEAPQRWADGGFRLVHEAPILLAFVRQLADEGWALAQSVLRSGAEATEAALRGMRRDDETARAPYRRGLDEQRADEHPDALRVLSSILARHAQASWGEAVARHAADSFPLAHGAPARVGRLRAYGNAIVAEQAAGFVTAFSEAAAAALAGGLASEAHGLGGPADGG